MQIAVIGTDPQHVGGQGRFAERGDGRILLHSIMAGQSVFVGHFAEDRELVAINAGCEVAQYGPNEVKQAVAGWGGAGKDEIERMVQRLLGIDQPLRPVDAADAVALALCHLAHEPMLRRAAAGRTAAGRAAPR